MKRHLLKNEPPFVRKSPFVLKNKQPSASVSIYLFSSFKLLFTFGLHWTKDRPPAGDDHADYDDDKDEQDD